MSYSSKKSLKRHRQTHSEEQRANNPDEIDDVDEVEEDEEKLDDDDEMCVDWFYFILIHWSRLHRAHAYNN